ncbi:hypothetical protein D929_00048 [Enterococcus faecalis 02-MB-P-10]|uniref:hypothetical protein n=1 Tax=Enterococcus faecalis TaxID=1351 RepID=UPI0003528089|nr:hypothetical protein [Enterococcus faecalis]EPH77723.1 hypothetical protein D929_00048 [Enterococcus faecalis 02-MB-P-10]
MSQKLITYLVCFITFSYLALSLYTYRKNKKNGYGYSIKIFYILASIIVFLLSVYAIVTGQTYDDLITKINTLLN